jgi:hypothetical protein
MRVRLRLKPSVPAAAAILLAVAVAACVPGGVRVGFGGVSVSTRGVGFGFGQMFSLASAGGSQGYGQGHSGQYQLPPTDGPRPVAATFLHEVACADRIGNNLGRGFEALDPDTGAAACFSCPEGYTRNGPSVPPSDPFACRHDGGGLFQSAENLGPPGCGDGTIQIGNACYSCPADMTPTGIPDPGSACLTAN